jgi:adenylate kinase
VRVICTGISGTERVGFLDEVKALAAQSGRDLQIFDVREAMFQIASDVGEPVEEETILDMFPHALVLLRAAALEKISSLADQAGEQQDWIINTHAVFRWKNTLISGFDPYYLQRLKPDLYVTITAGVLTVRERLRRHPRWEDTSIAELLVWREEEQWATEEMARIHHKPQYLLGRALPPRALYRLMFEPTLKTAYLSYPMQHAEGDRAALATFKQRLEERLLVFDPADVNDFEVESSAGSAGSGSGPMASVEAVTKGQVLTEGLPSGSSLPAMPSDGTAELRRVVEAAADGGRDAADAGPFGGRDLRHIADQIVFRDYKLIAQSDVVIVFYDALVPSPGVISEMNYALQTGKRVYGVWLPTSAPSPFFTRYCTRVFGTADELFAYFDRHGVAGSTSPPSHHAYHGAPDPHGLSGAERGSQAPSPSRRGSG